MSDEIKRNPSHGENYNLPRRHWKAAEPFFDLKFSHWIEIMLTLALVGIGIGQILVYVRQAGIMNEQTKISNRQLDILSSEQRPWISVEDATASEPFQLDPNGLRIALTYSLKNNGHSPATHVYPRTVTMPLGINSGAEQTKLCNTYDGLNGGGSLIFSNQSPKMGVTTYLNNADLQKETDGLKAQNAKMIFVNPVVIVCVQYKSLFDTVMHHTGFVYDLNPINITDSNTISPAPVAGHIDFLTASYID